MVAHSSVFVEQYDQDYSMAQDDALHAPQPHYPSEDVNNTPPVVRIERATPIQSAPTSPVQPQDNNMLTVNHVKRKSTRRPVSAPPSILAFDSEDNSSGYRNRPLPVTGELSPPPPPLCEFTIIRIFPSC